MRTKAPFRAADLEELDASLLSKAARVVAMEDIFDGDQAANVIGLRHDCDNDHSLEVAVRMARWEQERGYRSTYFILHTAPYWRDKKRLQRALDEITGCGHEIGFHLNALTVAIATGQDPIEIAREAVAELVGYGHPIRGVVAHGDQAYHTHRFVNDELFLESARPGYGAADRLVGGVRLRPIPRSELGFDYDPNWLPRSEYLSDSSGHWSQPLQSIAAGFPFRGQLHLLVHPDWWPHAFTPVRRAA